jgi:hypothetical protein
MKKSILLIILFSMSIALFAQQKKGKRNANATTTTNTKVKEVINVTLQNTSVIDRKDEVFEINAANIAALNPGILTSTFVVLNSKTQQQLTYQVVNNEKGLPGLLLVQTSLKAGETQTLTIKKGNPAVFKNKTYGRFVPERKDDFAWENDKIAFRMYGPALQTTGEISSGIDVWLKRTSEMVIDKWYKRDDYHVDHGEGLDCYKVGPTLGAGGIAPVASGKLFFSKNYLTYKVLASGTLRTVFELTYAPWIFNGTEISEKKVITLDAGSQLNKVNVSYSAKALDSIPVAVGIIKRAAAGSVIMAEKEGVAAYWEPANEANGTTGLGIVIPQSQSFSVIENHIVAQAKAVNNQIFTYYQGACWDKAGTFKNETDWANYLKQFAAKVKAPIIVKVN